MSQYQKYFLSQLCWSSGCGIIDVVPEIELVEFIRAQGHVFDPHTGLLTKPKEGLLAQPVWQMYGFRLKKNQIRE